MTTKFEHDKYYTPKDIVDKCMEILKQTINTQEIDCVIEPSQGNGQFINAIESTFDSDKFYLDLIPQHEGVKEQDYLEYNIEEIQGYKNILVLGNPPYGTRNTLSLRFFKKSIQFQEYVAFILPISQLDNINSLYEYDLIKSVDLGSVEYY